MANWLVFDDKHATWRDSYIYSHTHEYYDSDHDDISWDRSQNRITKPHVMVWYQAWWWASSYPDWWSEIYLNSDDHYTYSVNIVMPIKSETIIAPFIKFSSWSPTTDVWWQFEITPWKWVSWWRSALSIVKIANIWDIYNYNC